MKIGYLGPEGSYSYEAAKNLSQGTSLINISSFSEIFHGVESGIIDIGILPIENSTEGAVTPVMDGLLSMKKATIVSEVVQEIHHQLLSLGTLEEIKYVYSHPQAIEQCREYFKRQLPTIDLKPCSSTSEACRICLEGGSQYGAIASSLAGDLHGLRTIAFDIQDNTHNQTRFIVLGRAGSKPSGDDKTSIAFSFFDDYPGSLFQVLKLFAEENINLTRIESRPAKAELGKYIFYIDFKGHCSELAVTRVINNIKKITNKLIMFGSYPMGTSF